jgi:hypothetical protein
MMRVDLVDPSAYTPPYDHALAAALARNGASVRLITSRFAYGEVPAPDGYELREHFYRHARGAAGSKLRLATKLAEHGPDMLRYRALSDQADVPRAPAQADRRDRPRPAAARAAPRPAQSSARPV